MGHAPLGGANGSRSPNAAAPGLETSRSLTRSSSQRFSDRQAPIHMDLALGIAEFGSDLAVVQQCNQRRSTEDVTEECRHEEINGVLV